MGARRRRTKAELAAEVEQAELDRVVTWATVHGAPVMILQGWDPATGQWAAQSPIWQMLVLIEGGNYVGVAASRVGLRGVAQLISKGAEYLVDAAEDRAYIPVDILPFVDLHRAVEASEAQAELALVKVARKGADDDPKIAMMFLQRRFAQRWREQQTIFTGEDLDERDKYVSDAIADPNVASKLADVGHAIEDRVVEADNEDPDDEPT